MFEWKELLVQDKLLLPHTTRDHVIRKCHVVIDHRDAHDTYVLLTRLFCFERMLQNTNRIVRECLQCSGAGNAAPVCAARPATPPRTTGLKRQHVSINARFKAGRDNFRARQRQRKDADEERWLNAPAGNHRAEQKRLDDNNGNDFDARTATKREVNSTSIKMTVSFSNGVEIKIPA